MMKGVHAKKCISPITQACICNFMQFVYSTGCYRGGVAALASQVLAGPLFYLVEPRPLYSTCEKTWLHEARLSCADQASLKITSLITLSCACTKFVLYRGRTTSKLLVSPLCYVTSCAACTSPKRNHNREAQKAIPCM